MTVKMTLISTRFDDARTHPPPGRNLGIVFDAVVVGSGYGGAIAAAKLALTGQTVLLLERGREILPGDYPTDMVSAQRETQITTARAGRLTAQNGMMDLRINDDMHVIVGCGLGGTSLLNANVAIQSDPRVFQQQATAPDGSKRWLWPAVYRVPDALKSASDEAATALGANTFPTSLKTPNKLKSLQKSAEAMQQPFELAPINVTFFDQPNHFGNFQSACTMCGDCCSGCNYGAKNTTLMNYLPYAAANGAWLVTEAQVHTVAQSAGGWALQVSGFGQDITLCVTVRAKLVVLAAGTLGSTEILQRSKLAGLGLSPALGKRFSGNGDILGFGFDANWQQVNNTAAPSGPVAPLPVVPVAPIYSVGAGSNAPDNPQFMPGPCITGIIKVDMGANSPLQNGLVIEDGVAPGALAAVYPAVFFLKDVTTSDMTRFPDAMRRLQDIAQLGGTLTAPGGDLSTLSYSGAVANTQSYLVMSHDGSAGELVYDATLGIVTVDWPGAGQQFPFPRDNDMLRAASDAIWGNYLPNPIWNDAFGWNLVTVHPVGGCCMADSAAFGVVDANCRVYSGVGDAVYDGLMVCDGAVIPTSLGVNPLLTISAVTIFAMDALIVRNGWKVNPSPAKATSSSKGVPPPPPGDPFTVPAADCAALIATLQGYVDRIAKGEGNEVDKEIYDWAWTKAKSYGWKGVPLEVLLKAAYEGAAMATDISPAFQTLITDLQSVLAIIQPAQPQSQVEIASNLVAFFIATIGEITPALAFFETMSGSAAKPIAGRVHAISDPYRLGASQGRLNGTDLQGDFHIATPDLNALLADPDHNAALTGTLTLTPAGTGAGKSHPISNGRFQLLKNGIDEVDLWLMTYQGDLDDGLRFEGFKTLKRRAGSDWWTDLTTLNVDIYAGATLSLTGQMTLGLEDLVKQASTMSADYSSTETLLDLATDVTKAIVLRRFKDMVTDKPFLNKVFRYLASVYGQDSQGKPNAELAALEVFSGASAAAVFANLIFRTYGGLAAYLYNFPAQPPVTPLTQIMPSYDGGTVPSYPTVKAVRTRHVTADGANIQITRFQGGTKGPVILASGAGVIGMSFALFTNPDSIVQQLIGQGYDVWIFDHRASPANPRPANSDYSIDDIAQIDWPWAINTVLAARKDVSSVQIVAHCLGAVTVMMSLLGGYSANVRQLLINQFSVHPVTSAFNQMKSDTQLATLIRNGLNPDLRDALAKLAGSTIAGMFAPRPYFDLATHQPAANPNPAQAQDMALNAALWSVPFPDQIPCYSPTCHRVFGAFGPVYLHAQLNQATHEAIGQIVGEVASFSFEQLGLMMSKGYAVNAKGENVYLAHPERLDFPVHFMAGSLNQLVTPETTLRTQRWLQNALPASAEKFTREVFGSYGHIDVFWGRDAAQHTFPSILQELGKHSAP